MDDAPAFDGVAAVHHKLDVDGPMDGQSPAVLIAGRYREAVRAWYIVEQFGSSSSRSVRLEECVGRVEDEARALGLPARSNFLESARLLRVGDLTGSRRAFDLGLAASEAAPAVPPVAPSYFTARTDGPPNGPEVAVGPAAVRWDRLALFVYLVLLAAAELGVTFGNPLLVFPLHGGIIALATVHVAWLESRSERRSVSDALKPFLLAFIVVALIRIISLTLPLAAIEPPYRYLAAGVPMTVGALLVARASGFSMREIGFAWRMGRFQVIAIVGSFGLGFIEFAILRPAPLGPLPWLAAGVVPALVVGISTGFPEELIFRGVLQTATRPILGRVNWIYVGLVFAVLHIGYQSSLDLGFVFSVGLIYGWVFERSRSIFGISIGHGLANVILFFVAPNLPLVAGWLGI